MKRKKNEYKVAILILLLLVFYTVGFVGMHIDKYRNLMLGLSSLNLYLTLFFAFLAYQKIGFRVFLAFISIYFLGMISEWIGVHTGYLFGHYHYGNNLGSRLLGVPFVIGINWFLLVISSSAIMALFSFSKWIKITGGALLMTLFDYILEPIAIRNDYWSWETHDIPLYNYICWFIIAWFGQFIYARFHLAKQNSVHAMIYIIMFLFFILFYM